MKNTQRRKAFTKLFSKDTSNSYDSCKSKSENILYLDKIEVEDIQRELTDRVYLEIDKTKIWSQTSVDRGTYFIQKFVDLRYCPNRLRLYEDNSWSGDEFIGETIVTIPQLDSHQIAVFSKRRAYYKLSYGLGHLSKAII